MGPRLDRRHAGESAPTDAFVDHAGKKLALADFRGHTVLVNLWATWCSPCKAEMPALDRFAARANGRVTVLPISQDAGGWHAADTFFTPGRFPALTPYLDKQTALALKLNAAGLPTTILYDAQGREVWRVAGPLDWDRVNPATL